MPFTAILTALSRGLHIRTGIRVTRIVNDDNGRITVDAHPCTADTAPQRLTADAVVVTLPLGVLQSGAVTFEPALPDGVAGSIARLGMGRYEKLITRFDRVFWPADAAFLRFLSEPASRFSFVFSAVPSSGLPVLTALSGGDDARWLVDAGKDAAVAELMRLLRLSFGADVPEPVESVVTRWGSDPFALGSYSHLPPGASPADRAALTAPLWRGRLHLAGEHTHPRFPATMHGALLSGRRAADALLTGFRTDR